MKPLLKSKLVKDITSFHLRPKTLRLAQFKVLFQQKTAQKWAEIELKFVYCALQALFIVYEKILETKIGLGHNKL